MWVFSDYPDAKCVVAPEENKLFSNAAFWNSEVFTKNSLEDQAIVQPAHK